MPRYYFHLRDAVGFAEDEDGRELSGMQAVVREALKGARSIIADEVRKGSIDLSARIEVCDGERALVLTLPFSEAVELKTGGLTLPEASKETERP